MTTNDLMTIIDPMTIELQQDNIQKTVKLSVQNPDPHIF